MFKREETRHDFAFMAGVVIGAVAGAAATLAMAPRAGTETRERLRARMDEFQVDEYRSRATQSIKGAAATGSERVRDLASSAAESPLVETTKARVTEMVDRSPLPVKTAETDEPAEADRESASEFGAEVDAGDAERVFGAIDPDVDEQAERPSTTQS